MSLPMTTERSCPRVNPDRFHLGMQIDTNARQEFFTPAAKNSNEFWSEVN